MNRLSITSVPPPTVARLVTIGRFGLAIAGLVALLAGILDFFHYDGASALTMRFRVAVSLVLIACAVVAVLKPLRLFDLAGVVLAAVLAGMAVVFVQNEYDISAVSVFAFFCLVIAGGLTATGLAYGPPAVAEVGPGQAEADRVPKPTTRQAAPPGWYAQADGRTARYWNGSQWTDGIRPLPDPR